MNKKQKLTIEEMSKILHPLKCDTRTKAICIQYKVNKFTITWIKDKNKNIQNFAKIQFIQSQKNIKRISSIKFLDVENVSQCYI